jgi:hypothetical protein
LTGANRITDFGDPAVGFEEDYVSGFAIHHFREGIEFWEMLVQGPP